MKKFKKGQVCFEVETNQGERTIGTARTRTLAIYKYTVDACGLKKLTFENDALGSIYKSDSPDAKLIWNADAAENVKYHATLEGAKAAAAWYMENAPKSIPSWNLTVTYELAPDLIDQTIK